VLVERIVWCELPAPRRRWGVVIAGSGYVWFRFWLGGHNQVVERYYEPQGRLIGTQVDVCAPPTCDDAGCRAVDLLLDIWIAPDGRVTIYNEASFERAAAEGQLSAEQAAYAERRVRGLTGAIARGRFPPPIVRNWQIDPSRISRAAVSQGPSQTP
jgi:predicted RNA-binding protein associated with RNAse of E/G family